MGSEAFMIADSLIPVIPFINVLLASYNMQQLPKSSLRTAKIPFFN